VAAVYTPKDFDITQIMRDIVRLVGAEAEASANGSEGVQVNGSAAVKGPASAHGSA